MFCSEDRALICRQCDLMIHTANEFTKTHHRYILSGFVAGLRALPDVRPGAGAGAAAASAGAKFHMLRMWLPEKSTAAQFSHPIGLIEHPGAEIYIGGGLHTHSRSTFKPSPGLEMA